MLVQICSAGIRGVVSLRPGRGRRGRQADPRQRGKAQARRDQALGAAGQHRFRHRRRRRAEGRRRDRHRGIAEARRKDRNDIVRAGRGGQYRRDLHRHRQRHGAADGAHGHGVRQGRCRGAAVPHRGRPRLWARRVRRQGRHRHCDRGAEHPAGPEVQGLRAHHAVSQHQRGNRLARLARADREACQGARRHAQSRSRPRRRRHHHLAQGLRHHQGRGQGPRLACRRFARARPQCGDGAGASDAAAQQARQRRKGHDDQLHGASRAATARTSFRILRKPMPTSARW